MDAPSGAPGVTDIYTCTGFGPKAYSLKWISEVSANAIKWLPFFFLSQCHYEMQ